MMDSASSMNTEDRPDRKQSCGVSSIADTNSASETSLEITNCHVCKDSEKGYNPLVACIQCGTKWHTWCHNPKIVQSESKQDFVCAKCNRKSVECRKCQGPGNSFRPLISCTGCCNKWHGFCYNPEITETSLPFTCKQCVKKKKRAPAAASMASRPTPQVSPYTIPASEEPARAQVDPSYEAPYTQAAQSSITAAKQSTESIAGISMQLPNSFQARHRCDVCNKPIFGPVVSGHRPLCKACDIKEKHESAKQPAVRAATVFRPIQKNKLYPVQPDDRPYIDSSKRKRALNKQQDSAPVAKTKEINLEKDDPPAVLSRVSGIWPHANYRPGAGAEVFSELVDVAMSSSKPMATIAVASDELRSIGPSLSQNQSIPVNEQPSPPKLAISTDWHRYENREESPGSQIAQELRATNRACIVVDGRDGEEISADPDHPSITIAPTPTKCLATLETSSAAMAASAPPVRCSFTADIGHTSKAGHVSQTVNTSYPFACGICSRNFRFQKDFEIHYRSLHNDEPFSCEKCGFNFSRRDLFIHHSCRSQMISGSVKLLPRIAQKTPILYGSDAGGSVDGLKIDTCLPRPTDNESSDIAQRTRYSYERNFDTEMDTTSGEKVVKAVEVPGEPSIRSGGEEVSEVEGSDVRSNWDNDSLQNLFTRGRDRPYDESRLDSFLLKQSKCDLDHEPGMQELLATQRFGNIDPRKAWPFVMTTDERAAKLEEIKARGGRKANFGKFMTTENRRKKEEAERMRSHSDFVLNTQNRMGADAHREMFGTDVTKYVPAMLDGKLVMREVECSEDDTFTDSEGEARDYPKRKGWPKHNKRKLMVLEVSGGTWI